VIDVIAAFPGQHQRSLVGQRLLAKLDEPGVGEQVDMVDHGFPVVAFDSDRTFK